MNRKDRRAAENAGAPVHGSAQTELLYNQALAHHQLGQFNEAHQLYQQILQAEPNHADTLHKIGVMAMQLGQLANAVEFFNRAIALRDNMPFYFSDLGEVLLALGKLDDAEQNFRKALRLKKDAYEAVNGLANVLNRKGQYDEAAAQYKQAIALRPELDAAYNNFGSMLRDQAKLVEAAEQINKAIAIAPASVHALNNLGLVLRDQGELTQAADTFKKVISLNANFADAYNNLGLVLIDQGLFMQAVEQYKQALQLNPNISSVYSNLGNALQDLGLFNEAAAAQQKALELDPANATACLNVGNLFVDLGQPTQALTWYDQAIAIDARNIIAYKNRARALKDLGRLDEALASYDAAYKIDPDHEELAGLRLYLKMSLCDWSEYGTAATLIEKTQQGKLVAPPFALVGLPSTPQDQLACAKLFVARKCPPAAQPLYKGPRKAHPKIRIAYLSADLREHPVAQLAVGMFEAHDKSAFETTAISFGADDKSAIRSRIIKAFDRFIDARMMTNDQVAQLLLQHGIDIAVDLTGFTQNNRVGVFAKRVAPVQVSYLGFPGTMGVPYFDYVIADKTVVPPDMQPAFSEKVVYLPDTYQANDRQRVIAARTPTRAELGLPEQAFVFCSFNASYKITPEVFDIWMRLLKAADGSVLWLLESNKTAAANLRREAQQRGIASGRLIFAPKMPNADHLARHRLADLFLDNLPCNAHTTASDALYAGLPVLTCMGNTFAGRVAASLLQAAGLPELITQSLQEYEQLALQLARDPQKLAALKTKLAQNRDTCALFDTQKFTRNIEAAYRDMLSGV